MLQEPKVIGEAFLEGVNKFKCQTQVQNMLIRLATPTRAKNVPLEDESIYARDVIIFSREGQRRALREEMIFGLKIVFPLSNAQL